MNVRIEHGEVHRGATRALRAAVLELPGDANVGIIGINGAGKSTLMHGLAGSLRRRAGRLDLVRVTPDVIAYSPQQPVFPEWLRTEQVLALYGLGCESLERMLPELLLEELRGRFAGSLSVGQRQALSVGVSLGLAAPLTMLDEPFAAIDFRRRVGLISILRRHAGRGLTLISSQNGADLLATCSWLVVLREGEYVFSGPCEELTGSAPDPARALLSFEANVLALLGVPLPVDR